MLPSDPLAPLVNASFALPAELISSTDAWSTEISVIGSPQHRASVTAYLEMLGQGLNEPVARVFRELLAEIRSKGGASAIGGEPYCAWAGSLVPVLRLTLLRALQRVITPSVALSTIRWIVENADIRRTGEAWLALAYGLDDDEVGAEPGHVQVMPEEAVFDYLGNMKRDLTL